MIKYSPSEPNIITYILSSQNEHCDHINAITYNPKKYEYCSLDMDGKQKHTISIIHPSTKYKMRTLEPYQKLFLSTSVAQKP